MIKLRMHFLSPREQPINMRRISIKKRIVETGKNSSRNFDDASQSLIVTESVRNLYMAKMKNTD